MLEVYLIARRTLLFERFIALWEECEQKGVWQGLERAAERELERAEEVRRQAERAERARKALEAAERARREAESGGSQRSRRARRGRARPRLGAAFTDS